ncbi:ankyrin repeat and SOCS box protein 11 isoform X2 [Gouania willdenowi]|nr:ankyrin repeat and SOCS box protein 11-like isoform X2 [Gouania willdenowi]
MADHWSDRSPLHAAAFQGRLVYLRNLVEHGMKVDLLTVDSVSPLHEACLSGHADCVKFLLDHGADPDRETSDGATPLFYACCSGNAACVRLVLECSSSLMTDCPLVSPIHEAARKEHAQILEFLVRSGAQIDTELPGLGTPLFSACMSKAIDCADFLLHAGADVNRGCGKESPLHAAVRRGDVCLVNLLLDFGADDRCRNAEGKTPVELSQEDSAVRTALETRDELQKPRSLYQLCRVLIRYWLGGNRQLSVSNLPIPQVLKDYLLYR